MKRYQRLVMEDSCAKRYPSRRQSSFSCPIGVVQAILCIFGFGKETKQKRVSGKVVRLHRITDPLHHFAITKVLSHWEARPELVLGD